MGSRRVSSFAGAILLLAAIAIAPMLHAQARAPWVGRPLTEVLQALQSDRLRFLYSSQLVSPSLAVTSEPRARTALGIAREVLAAHRLGLEAVEPGVWAVVPLGEGEAAPAAAASSTVDPLAEVVVSVSRYSLGDDVGSAVTMDAAALGDQPGIGNDPLRALQQLPGITGNGLSARSNVRGSDPSESLLLLDGYPLRQPFHLAGYQSLFSVLDAGLVDSAEVFTGGFPVRYGNRMAAVFDLRSVDPASDTRESLGVDVFNASARAAGTEGPWGTRWLGLGRVGTLRPVLHVFAPSAGSPTYSDLYLKATRGEVDRLRVTANLLWSRDELPITDEGRGEQARIEGRVRYGWLQLERAWNDVTVQVWLGQTRIESLREGSAMQAGIVDAAVDDARDARLSDLRGRVRWQPAPRQSLEGGIELTDASGHYRYDSRASYSPAVTALFDRDALVVRTARLRPRRDQAAAFVSHRWALTGDITTEAGLRAQRLATRGDSRNWLFDPRFGMRWELDERTNLKLHWGRFHQVDEINELQVEDGLLRFDDPQRSEHRIVGIERRLDERLSVRVEAFEKRQSRPRERFENLLNQQTILAELAPDRIALQPLQAQLRGVELTGSYREGPLSAWTSLGWSKAFDRFERGTELRNWDQTWSLTGGARWARGPWLLSGALNAHRGWPTTELRTLGTGDAVLDPRNSDRLPLFLQLDVRAQYTLRLAASELALSAEVMNAQERVNACCSELGVSATDPSRLTERRLYWLPVIPSLGVRWTF